MPSLYVIRPIGERLLIYCQLFILCVKGKCNHSIPVKSFLYLPPTIFLHLFLNHVKAQF